MGIMVVWGWGRGGTETYIGLLTSKQGDPLLGAYGFTWRSRQAVKLVSYTWTTYDRAIQFAYENLQASQQTLRIETRDQGHME